jgi:hypothetical protein
MKQRMGKLSRSLSGLVAVLALTLGGCSASDGKDGVNGANGTNGTNGANGTNGTNGTNGGNVAVTDFHGAAFLTAEDELQGAPANPKYLANIAITGATADAAGVATVTFTVKKKDNVTPVTGLTAASAGIFKLAPAEASGRSFNRWVPYIYRSGRTVNAGYRESTSTAGASLVENSAGTYTYTFGTNLSTAQFAFPIDGVSVVGYDRSLTHRVSVYLGGHSGPTGEADFDFVPDGVTALDTRDIVRTETCKKCHGGEFHGHGGDRVTVEGCNACHSPDSAMVNTAANGGTTESIEMAVMIHRMHAGRELASAPGADGVFFDDPATAADESADNGTYTLGSITASWRSAAFPAGIENCTVCHTGGGADVDNWKTVPSRAACGSCHDLIDWAAGTNHEGGAAANDAACALCHTAAKNVTAHDWTAKDIRNIPEFNVSITTSAPANGTHFVAGESPVITIVLSDPATGTPIDHTTVVEDAAGEGCVTTATDTTTCTNAADGQFRAGNLYVNGPRAKRIPVLTTAARAKVTSALVEPWNLSAGGASLRLVVDNGNFIVKRNHYTSGSGLEDVLVPGDFTVTLPAAGAALDALFADPRNATAAEVAAWLNGDTATFDYNEREFHFRDRAIAYVENGRLLIRTRALGSENPSIQVPVAANGLGIFTDTAVKIPGQANQLRAMTDPTKNDPKAVRTAASITYTLDPVDDLVPGTYMINVEMADRGRGAATGNYRTPSIGVATFQVKQADVEKPIADGCTSCHWSTNAVGQGVGFVLDPVRHNKPFNAQAIDQCGGCHDYASGETTASLTWTNGGGGGKPIGKRVHSVHVGSSLNYPVITIDHEDTTMGRGWQITYPQDVRNCESCHSAATSGTWKTTPSRLACMGCHDSDAATAHMKLQVYDPTPVAPWSGDEQESCAACHQ